MKKFELQQMMKDAEIFEICNDMIATIHADENPAHMGGNKRLLFYVENISRMGTDVMACSIFSLIDWSSRLFGLVDSVNWIGGQDMFADVEFDAEDLHRACSHVAQAALRSYSSTDADENPTDL